MKLVDKMIEHRSPCHSLNEKEVESIKEVVKKARKLDKGITFITWGILLYILKNLYDLLLGFVSSRIESLYLIASTNIDKS